MTAGAHQWPPPFLLPSPAPVQYILCRGWGSHHSPPQDSTRDTVTARRAFQARAWPPEGAGLILSGSYSDSARPLGRLPPTSLLLPSVVTGGPDHHLPKDPSSSSVLELKALCSPDPFIMFVRDLLCAKHSLGLREGDQEAPVPCPAPPPPGAGRQAVWRQKASLQGAGGCCAD